MLARADRLTRGAEYRAVYDGGRSGRSEHLVCLVLGVPGERTRAGVVASRRVGGSVERNRAKRRLRHALRNLWTEIPAQGYHIVCIATRTTGKVDYGRLNEDLRRLLLELGVELDTPPRDSPAPPPDADTS